MCPTARRGLLEERPLLYREIGKIANLVITQSAGEMLAGVTIGRWHAAALSMLPNCNLRSINNPKPADFNTETREENTKFEIRSSK